MADGLRVGITFYWGECYSDMWSSGAGQNVYFLYKTIEALPQVKEVYLVHNGCDVNNMPERMYIKEMPVQIRELKDVLDITDVVIEGLLKITPDVEELLNNHHIKTVSYQMGQTYVADMEKLVNNSPEDGTFNGVTYDAIWLLPHHMHTSHDYLEIMYRSKVSEVPMVWDPFFFDLAAERQGGLDLCKYKNTGLRAKRVVCFDSNMTVVKTSIVPALIAEEAYREDPDLIRHIYLLNTVHLKDVPSFKDYVGYMRSVANNTLTVEGWFIAPGFMANYADVVLAFQMENGLNYSYFESLYADYPLVHNSPFLHEADVGYYYHDFDAYDGAHQLLSAIKYYDQDIAEHKKRNKAYLAKLAPTHKAKVKAYGRLLEKVVSEEA